MRKPVSLCLLLAFAQCCFAQNSERVVFDASDSTSGYYLAVAPKETKATIVLLTSFAAPESLLAETRLHNIAFANGILTVFVPMQQKLFADDNTVARLSRIIEHVQKNFNADTSRFALIGYDEATMIALRYAELAHQFPAKYKVIPKAVIGIDAHVDLFGLWRWSERQIHKNFWQGAVNDAKFYQDVLKKELGDPAGNREKYSQLSPFVSEATQPGNEQYLRNVSVRLYYDMDMDWQLQNRRNSLYDTKMPDGSELISRLLLMGHPNAAFKAARQPGFRSNGMRSPNALSIVDETECIQWLKKALDVFDPLSWTPPYYLDVPAGWGTEHFALPPDFASGISYKGVEDLRFAPGWADPKSEQHWAYSYLWWLEGNPVIDAPTLQRNLELYYAGLVSRNLDPAKMPADKIPATKVQVKKTAPQNNDIETFSATINMLDYHTQKPIVLSALIHRKPKLVAGRTPVYIEISPQPSSHPVWKAMSLIGHSLRIKSTE
jgi:hypothetical protein